MKCLGKFGIIRDVRRLTDVIFVDIFIYEMFCRCVKHVVARMTPSILQHSVHGFMCFILVALMYCMLCTLPCFLIFWFRFLLTKFNYFPRMQIKAKLSRCLTFSPLAHSPAALSPPGLFASGSFDPWLIRPFSCFAPWDWLIRLLACLPSGLFAHDLPPHLGRFALVQYR